MNYAKENYIGKAIQLYPGDYVSKWGEILNVDDLGWTIKITKVNKANDPYNADDVIFISHSQNFTFKFM
jgi:hypothetical protein